MVGAADGVRSDRNCSRYYSLFLESFKQSFLELFEQSFSELLSDFEIVLII